MFECLILGDSTGVGTAKEVNARYAGRCDVLAVERATAEQILAWRKPSKRYGTCIFAMGSNDDPRSQLTRRLIAIRKSIASRRVIWLLPYSRPRAYLVNTVAIAFADESLDLQRFRTNDLVHPARYSDVAATLLR